MLKPILFVAGYLNVNCGLEIPQLGLEKESVGHYVLLNVGTVGLQQRFAPHIPQMKTLGLCTLGKIEKKPWVVDDKIAVQDIMNTTQNIDSRFGDPSIMTPLQLVVRGYLADPKNFDPT